MQKHTEQELVRRAKLKKYEELGIQPFSTADGLKKLHLSDSILMKCFPLTREELEQKQEKVAVSGRIIAIR